MASAAHSLAWGSHWAENIHLAAHSAEAPRKHKPGTRKRAEGDTVLHKVTRMLVVEGGKEQTLYSLAPDSQEVE